MPDALASALAEPGLLWVCGASLLAGLVYGFAGFGSALIFRIGTALIGFGLGLFSVGTLTAAMALADDGHSGRQSGIVLGAWGAVQATAAGLAIAFGGALRDLVSTLAEAGHLGSALSGPAAGYSMVYHFEILLLFATLIAIGPLVRPSTRPDDTRTTTKFGLAEFPG